MHHVMPAGRKFAAQRDRERMACVVVDDDFHEAGECCLRGSVFGGTGTRESRNQGAGVNGPPSREDVAAIP